MIDASGGSGKPIVLDALIAFLKIQKKKVIVVTSSGVELTLLIDMTTTHSAY